MLAVTHNPVIAAAADRHFVVSKAAPAPAPAPAPAAASGGTSGSSSGGGYAPQRSTVREVCNILVALLPPKPLPTHPIPPTPLVNTTIVRPYCPALPP